MKGQRFPSPMSTARATTAGQLQFQEHLPTPEAEEGRVCSHAVSWARHLPFALLVLPFPFSAPIHAAEGDLWCGWVGTGCSFQVQELFLPPTSRPRALLTVTRPQGTPSFAHFLKQVLAASESLARHIRADAVPGSFRHSSSGMGAPNFYF